jgi:Tfp pilus assembly protein PilX
MKSKQSGITLIGFLIIIVVVGFFAYMAMKLLP